jgi:SAF domain protein
MAVNPMQKKARNSFLLGMIITLVVCAIIGVILYIAVIGPENKASKEKGTATKAYALNRDVKSGQEITADMLSTINTYSNLIPQNYIDSTIVANVGNGKKVIAKVDLYKNTILTASTVTTEENTVTKDVRTMEYNMLTLPINLTIGDYVDIRITFPDGQDFIVIAKKEIKNIQGNTVTFDMSEADIVMLNSAIVESYIMKASNIYIAKYVEPGMQEKAANTYVPTAEVIRLIETDSNIVATAKNELTSRFDANIRNQMNSTVNQYSEQGLTNVEEGIQKQIEDAKKAREEYLSSLAQ